MSSKIEQLIDEMEEYIDNCKYSYFPKGFILVKKDEFDDFLHDLRRKTPEEIKNCQKIIQNREAILDDAKQKAQKLLNDAAVQTNELISEHQIMQQAYAQANDIVELATKQAQDILDNATIEANNVKISAMRYADNMLANLESMIKQFIEITTKDCNDMIGHLKEIDSVVTANRAELVPDVMEDSVSDNDTGKSETV